MQCLHFLLQALLRIIHTANLFFRRFPLLLYSPTRILRTSLVTLIPDQIRAKIPSHPSILRRKTAEGTLILHDHPRHFVCFFVYLWLTQRCLHSRFLKDGTHFFFCYIYDILSYSGFFYVDAASRQIGLLSLQN